MRMTTFVTPFWCSIILFTAVRILHVGLSVGTTDTFSSSKQFSFMCVELFQYSEVYVWSSYTEFAEPSHSIRMTTCDRSLPFHPFRRRQSFSTSCLAEALKSR